MGLFSKIFKGIKKVVKGVAKVIKKTVKGVAKVVKKVAIFFPNQKNRGTHINISGAGIAKYAPNKENAIKFIEYLDKYEIINFMT